MKRIEDVTYWRDRKLQGVESCRVVGSAHVFPKHAHDGVYAVGLMEEGGSYLMGTDKDGGFVAPGDIALINPGQVHSGVPIREKRATYRMLYVDIRLMRDAATDLCRREGVLPEFTTPVNRNPVLKRMIENLTVLIPGEGGCLEKESLLFETLTGILEMYGSVGKPAGNPGRGRNVVRRAREFLSEDLDQRVSLEAVAGAVGLSRYHFLRVFKRETGLPPHVFRTIRRIEAAKQLLKKGMPVSMAALETGFTDQSHFSNKFKQFTGATPRQYI